MLDREYLLDKGVKPHFVEATLEYMTVCGFEPYTGQSLDGCTNLIFANEFHSRLYTDKLTVDTGGLIGVTRSQPNRYWWLMDRKSPIKTLLNVYKLADSSIVIATDPPADAVRWKPLLSSLHYVMTGTGKLPVGDRPYYLVDEGYNLVDPYDHKCDTIAYKYAHSVGDTVWVVKTAQDGKLEAVEELITTDIPHDDTMCMLSGGLTTKYSQLYSSEDDVLSEINRMYRKELGETP